MMPSGPGAPQGAPQAPQSAPKQQGNPAQFVSMIETGIKGLMPMIQHADPHLQKAFGAVAQSFQGFMQMAQQPHGSQPPSAAPAAPQPAGGPMAAGASPKSQPLPQG